MTINKLSENSLKIFLDTDDFVKYNLNSSKISPKTIKNFLLEISNDISELMNSDITSSKFFVEVFSYKNSCIIFLSSMSDIKQQKDIICQFNNFENLECFCRTLNALYKSSVKSSILYSCNNNIRLILKLNSDSNNISRFASGYCTVLPFDEINNGINEEYYNKIIHENAVREILLSVS